MAYEGYRCLRVRCSDGVGRVTLDHPPINLLDLEMMMELDRVGRELESDAGVKVVVLDSADPEFFIAHADVELILRLVPGAAEHATELNFFHAMVDRFRTMPKATIAKIEGIARGGGSELALSFDMRFAALGRAVLAQPEVALGILPGGSGTQRLPRLIGRARALEVVLGCEDVPADLAEQWGYVNRALPPGDLEPFVARLAARIAAFPADAIRLAKASVDAAEQPVRQGLLDEARFFERSLATPGARERMRAFVAHGGQTRDAERSLETLIGKL